MLLPLIFAAAAAFLFYIALPVAGAFGARASWRVFRRRLLAASGFPRLQLHSLLRHSETQSGNYQHYGAVEAIQGQDRVWIRGTDVTASVSLEHARICLLPASRPPNKAGAYDLEEADESLKSVMWKSLSGLEEGARLYAAGRMRPEGGLPVFEGTASEPLLVLIYDGRDEDLIPRALWAGRHRNEYWNPVTLASMAAGFLAAGTAFFSLLQPPRLSLPAALSAAITISPVIPFLPPGIFLLSVFQRLWTRARRLRARRDLLRGGFPDPRTPGTAEIDRDGRIRECVQRALKSEIYAGLALCTALAVNSAWIVVLVRAVLR